jgi:uncharacterized RDD family membrane protein YckC
MKNANAHPLLRILAELIEVTLFSFLFIFCFSYFYSGNLTDLKTLWINLVNYLSQIFLPLLLILFFYRAVFTNLFGGNIGKLLTGLAVVSDSHTPLTFKRLLLRYNLGYIFSGTCFGIGYWSVFKDPDRKTWHDHAFGSKVIVRSPIWPAGLLCLFGLLYGIYYFGLIGINNVSASPLIQELYLNYQKQQALKEASDSATPSGDLNQVNQNPSSTGNTNQQPLQTGPGYNKVDIDNLVAELKLADKDFETISTYYKAVSSYNQTTITQILTIIPQRKALAQKLLDKMGKGQNLTTEDLRIWDQYDALTVQQNDLVRSLYNGNGGN